MIYALDSNTISYILRNISDFERIDGLKVVNWYQ